METNGTTVFERRMRAEWRLLERLAAANPGRLVDLRAVDRTIHLTLRRTPGIVVSEGDCKTPIFALPAVEEHRLRVEFPEYFPAAPMELYLDRPAVHPNIHPETGFVCLWERHRVGNTIEHALHKTVAILGWRLRNLEPIHVMQNDVLHVDARALIERLAAPSLIGALHPESEMPSPTGVRRIRLS